MDIALISPKTHSLQHRVRGSGFYIESLKKSLLKFDKKNNYIFLIEGGSLPKSIDLVHYPFFEPFFLTLPFTKKTKTVVTVHDLTPLVFQKNFPKGVKGGLKWQIQKRAIKNADAIITDSQSSKADILKFVGVREDKVKVVYLASSDKFKRINLSDSKIKSFRSKYKLPDKFALYVGDVTWNKNLPRLVEAAEKANTPLILVGKALVEKEFDKNNPWNQDLVKVQGLIKDSNHIKALGFIPDGDLALLYNLATLFIMPSLYEGFGLPILEAMSSGCPVVTSREGSITEVAGDAAFYVDAYNTSSIASGIKKVFSDENLRSELSKKGLAQTKKFSWQKVALETVEVYESV